jgi:hypothetical protein
MGGLFVEKNTSPATKQEKTRVISHCLHRMFLDFSFNKKTLEAPLGATSL